MTDLILFDFQSVNVRVIQRPEGPWWIAADVAAILGYRNAPDMVRNLDPDEADTQNMRSSGQNREMTIISESGLYHAIFASRRPEAQAFRRWVTSHVLPTLRRNGQVGMPAADEPLLRLRNALATRQYVTTTDAATLVGFEGTDANLRAAGLLRALGWRKAWIQPETCRRMTHDA
jgi:prophage antirepressor-like protein